jgi:hypothetical protein
MKKKKAKSKTAAKKTAKKSEPELETKELNPEQVLKNISALVEAQADKLAEAVIGEGMKGQVSPVKYLFEMAHIYPQPPAAIAPNKDEDSLAETLLDRLKIPKTPMVHDELQKEEEDEDVVVIQPKKDTGTDSESSGDEKTEAVGVE